MKRLLSLCLLVILLIGCKSRKQDNYENRNIKVDFMLPTTPIKDQGASSSCWIYGMLATIETEHLVQGDSVNLSADCVIRMYLREQAMQRLYGKHKFGNKDIGTRGMMPMTIDLINTYGLQHEDAFHRDEHTNYNVIARKLSQLTNGISDFTLKDIDDYLDKSIACSPKQVFMYGAIYTPQEFAHSVCSDNEYTPITSFMHHPFNERFPLEVPDNKYHSTYLNLPLDKMMRLIEESLHHHHPVCWEGDVSEKGFNWQEGIADIDASDLPITPEKRQKAFEHHTTTDDHVMAIIGMGHDAKGKKYFLCKNSWGKSNRYGGFIFLSYDYVKYKTIALMVKI